ncbi:MAG: invasin domain 3-containing protein [Myxococcota bacterium]
MRSTPLVLLLVSVPALSRPTILTLRPEAPNDPYSARYSQALLVKAELVDDAGQPVAQQRVTFRLHPADDESAAFVFSDPVTDAVGRAEARLVLVNGSHGGQTFTAAAPTSESPGAHYVIEARFAGDAFAEDCEPESAAPVDDDLCAAVTTHDLYLLPENTTLTLQPGIEVELGGTVMLMASLQDDNGDAPAAGIDTDGTAPRPLAERRVSFFYDLNGNGRPELAERIGCANGEAGAAGPMTDARGIASCAFVADPSYVDTRNVEDGIHAQFGGDAQYALAGASQALYVRAAPPDAARTQLEVNPAEAPADGFSRISVTATLVDGAGNPLGADDPAYQVRLETDLGEFDGEVGRDLLTGQYRGTLVAPRTGGEATVFVFVDDVRGTQATVRFVSQGCSSMSVVEADGALWGLLLLFIRRRRHNVLRSSP